MDQASTGHTVLAVPVPALDAVVRARTEFYDASFVSADPAFVHAHITVLAPWVARPGPADLAAIGEIARGTAPFEVRLGEVAEFPDGTIHLVPDPADGLRALTARTGAAFPAHPPYAGAYGDVAPHLTLDRRSRTVTPEWVLGTVAHLLPLTVRVDRIDLQWWGNHACRLLQSWPLGRSAPDPEENP